MPKITVVKKISRTEFELVEIDEVDDVLYVCVREGLLHFQTHDGLFKQISTLEEQQRYTEKLGYVKVERGYLVNMTQAESYDPKQHTIDFGEGVPKVAVSKPFRANVPENIHLRKCQVSFNVLNGLR
ncbi:LytTR family transcriptional regulator DNA-binding domain-containing protein [Paenibacillus sp. GCM10012307]|uniref:LytTR family transcriptional regulator DNA-binding domain-containing protein n=1 Tax=Paenibacillus roseus TaxID=2798579 RepID=A0A934JCC1_9BACL|nr:LytTR family transcriptional regulator DNA-binding domain-containing protein [Paenibacillus roseus]MBJ6364205.1 LytTR family transcriptional regulator DNA-binding domain-containing protein [Paenibacillus roseus]